MTARELIEKNRPLQPHLRYAVNGKDDAIGVWYEKQGRFVMVAGLLITGQWYNMPSEVWANGKPVVSDWTEV